jgi:hypothetical protein
VNKHLILHACKHEAERELRGNRNSQAWQAKQWAAKPCPTCWRADVDSASAEAMLTAEEHNWPALVGTDPQIAWARTVRGELVDTLPSRMVELTKMADARGTTFDNVADAIVLAREIVLAQTSAAWWIESRSTLAEAIPAVPGVRGRLKQAGATGRTASALLMWAGAAMAS